MSGDSVWITNVIRYHICIAVFLGFLLDLVLGDPETWPHPVRAIGGMIAGFERMLYPRRDIDQEKFWNGFMLAVAVPAVCGTAAWLLLYEAYRFAWKAGLFLETVMCWQILSVKSLKDASMKVCRSLESGDLEAARHHVSMIVGRDTEKLDQEGIVKAAVETVAENTSDGVTAPLFYLALGGPCAGWVYKAVSTMDSMIAYKNARYRHFGTCAALLDDIVNFVPARLAGLLMVAAAGLCGYDRRGAWRVFRRDRLRHESPNSAHTEAACAGALRVQPPDLLLVSCKFRIAAEDEVPWQDQYDIVLFYLVCLVIIFFRRYLVLSFAQARMHLRSRNEEFYQRSRTDELTGLLNREA